MSIMECAVGCYPYFYGMNSSERDKHLKFWDLFMLVKDHPAPKLSEDEFSQEFVDFIDICLQKDPSKRPTAAQLMNHPFILTYENRSPAEIGKWLNSL